MTRTSRLPLPAGHAVLVTSAQDRPSPVGEQAAKPRARIRREIHRVTFPSLVMLPGDRPSLLTEVFCAYVPLGPCDVVLDPADGVAECVGL
jgi:hypothetical protein